MDSFRSCFVPVYLLTFIPCADAIASREALSCRSKAIKTASELRVTVGNNRNSVAKQFSSVIICRRKFWGRKSEATPRSCKRYNKSSLDRCFALAEAIMPKAAKDISLADWKPAPKTEHAVRSRDVHCVETQCPENIWRRSRLQSSTDKPCVTIPCNNTRWKISYYFVIERRSYYAILVVVKKELL